MTFPLTLQRLRVGTWAGVAALAMLAACSKDNKTATEETSGAAPAATTLGEPEQRIITQARAAVGPEAKLNAVNAVLLTGKIVDDKNADLGTIVLLFQKPGKQHTELHMANQTLIQGSDGVVGWVMSVDKNGSKTMSVLKAPDEMQNLYTTMENLYFYRAADRVKGSVVHYEGDVDYRGTKAHKISFQYPNSITYVRYFDSVTGKLLGTVMLPSGSEVVENGTTQIEGINFPAALSNYNKDGKLTQGIKFDKITVNPKIDPKAKIFDLPDMVALAKAAAAAKSAATAKPAASGTGAAAGTAPKPTGTTPGFPSPQSLMKKN